MSTMAREYLVRYSFKRQLRILRTTFEQPLKCYKTKGKKLMKWEKKKSNRFQTLSTIHFLLVERESVLKFL